MRGLGGGARESRTLEANMAMVAADRLHSPLNSTAEYYITKLVKQKGLPKGSPTSSADGLSTTAIAMLILV